MKKNPDAIPVSEWSRLAKGKGELILLVEGDRLLQVLSQRILTKLGYEVLLASSPQLAVVLWKTRAEEVKLILTDYPFGDAQTGLELVHKIHKLAPELPILMVCAAGRPDAKTDPPLPSHTAYLMKPYSLAYLAHTLHRLLTERNAQALPWVPRERASE
ncbi:MAG: hypothetical protein RL514_4009 [Verrucomicrobiota bacterium]